MSPPGISTPPSVTQSPAKSPANNFIMPVSMDLVIVLGRIPENFQFTVPPGWTSTPPSPVYHEEWEGIDSEGQIIARCYGLEPGQPVMEDDQAWVTIFRSGDKFYLWERMDDEVYEIVSRDIAEIAFVISQSELRELARVPLARIEC
ncbi:hypothetical protein PITC_031390 [Penicillium italicum]|uniref:Uncharacterized protein n=1 Tax=Penicillium italicum TaxID=40296 RepID=A0A0A2L512_PENIT|nr:hypothetical protein PITC_031390 [Penicillium italicum]